MSYTDPRTPKLYKKHAQRKSRVDGQSMVFMNLKICQASSYTRQRGSNPLRPNPNLT